MEDVLYHFDVLPVHPQPELLESLTSYLTRLAEVNRVSSVGALSDLCFPGRHRQYSITMKDFPPVSLEALSVLTASSETELRATTFYHLALKFGYSPKSNGVKRFLNGAIASGLRYCPQCVAVHQYYSLLWRFTCLMGCSEHHCCLLDRCGHCGCTIPLIITPFAIQSCPECGKDLGLCKSEPLTREVLQSVKSRFCDLEYLVSPQSWENSCDAHLYVGQRLRHWRKERRLEVGDLARQAEVSRYKLMAIERGDMKMSITLQLLFRLVDCLEISVRGLLDTVLDTEPERSIRKWERVTEERESTILIGVQQAVEQLESQGVFITMKTVTEFIGEPPCFLSEFPRVRGFFQRLREYQRIAREDALVVKVQEAIETLESDGQPISQRSVCRIVGINRGSLRRYPKVLSVLNQASTRRKRYKRENEYLGQVREAIRQLQLHKEPITQKTIAEISGLSVGRLRHYPKVRSLVEKAREEDRAERRKALEGAVREAVEQLISLGERVTQRAVSRMVGVSYDHLMRCPEIRAFLEQTIFDDHCRGGRFQREEELVDRVMAAAEDLMNRGDSVTAKAICRATGLSYSAIYYHPRAAEALREMQSARNVETKSSLDEDELVDRVQKAVDDLHSLGKLATQTAVSEAIGVDQRTLKRYPRVRALLSQQAEARRAQLVQNRLRQVEEVVRDLVSRGERVSRWRVAEALGIGLSALRHYPEVRDLITQALDQERLGREHALFKDVLAAIEILESDRKPITHVTVCELAKVHPECLRRYPWLKELVKQAKERGAIVWEEDLVSRVQEAIESLREAGKPITRKVISEMVGVSVSRLASRLQVKSIIMQAKAQQNECRRGVRLARRVVQVAERLEALDMPVTQTAIAENIGMSLSGIRYYPEAKKALKDAVDRAKVRREADLFQRVQVAAERIEASEGAVTQVAAAEIVGMSPGGLRRHPRIKVFFDEIAERRRHRESVLVEQTRAAIRTLEHDGDSVSQVAVGEIVGMSPSGLRKYASVREIMDEIATRNGRGGNTDKASSETAGKNDASEE